MRPFKRKNEKMKRPLIPCVSRGFRIRSFFYGHDIAIDFHIGRKDEK